LDGKTHYLGRYGSARSKAEYNRLISEWLAGGRRLSGAEDLSLAELILAYWNAVGKKITGGRADNLKAALKIVKETYGHVRVPEFGPKALKIVRERMRDKDWSRSYVNAQVGWIKRLFRWGAEEELVGGDQVHALWAVKGVRKGTEGFRECAPVKPVSPDDVQAVLPHLPPVVAVMVQLQLLCGCRPAEICRLRTTDLDMSRPDLWLYRPAAHKGEHLDKDRVIYFGPKAIELLKPWLRADGKPLFSPARSEEERNARRRDQRHSPVTPSQSKRRRQRNRARPWGECYAVGNYRNCLYRACALAGISRFGPHRLRHTRASEVRALFGLEAAQVFVGHARCDVTQVYAERNTKLGEEVARQIG
jgi:integrase